MSENMPDVVYLKANTWSPDEEIGGYAYVSQSKFDTAFDRAEKAEAEVARLTTALQTASEDAAFHPRAAKLMRKRKNFVVVAEDELYYMSAYENIRFHELQRGRWNDEDERHYQDARDAARRAHYAEGES